MAYDQGLAERVHEYFAGKPDVEIKKMFGGLCFMVSRHMCCGILDDRLMARIGPDIYESCLLERHVKEMDFTGKALKGMVYIEPEGIEDDAELEKWINRCELFVQSLPPKKAR